MLLCFVFAIFGYTIGNFNTLKERFCSNTSKQENLVTESGNTLNDTASIYVVKEGDSLETVSKLFGVSKEYIMTTNNMKSEKISKGDIILITNSINKN